MIQTLNTTYYTVTKYKGSDLVLTSTNYTTYTLEEIISSYYQSISDWIDVCKENCKRFTNIPSKENVNSKNVSKILIKKQRRQHYMGNDKLTYHNKIITQNYNPFSPLFEAEIKGKVRSSTMADDIARHRSTKLFKSYEW
jgi:hypothetical protein